MGQASPVTMFSDELIVNTLTQIQETQSEILALLKREVKPEKRFLSLSEVSDLTGLSKSKIYTLTSRRQSPFLKPSGGKLLFKRNDVEAWLEGSGDRKLRVTKKKAPDPGRPLKAESNVH